MLRNYLMESQPEDILFISKNGAACSAGQLRTFCHGHAALLRQAENKNIAVLMEDDFSLALYLILLDGCCSRLTLLPPDEDAAQIELFLSKSDTDLLVTTQGSSGYPIKTIKVDEVELLDPPEISDAVEPADGCETEWIITTSGTTGDPKLVRHTIETLTRTAKRRTSRSNTYSWGLLYKLTRFAGLQVLFQSVVGGSCLVFPDDHDTLNGQIDHLAAQGCNALSATPTMWRKILMQPGARHLPLRQITLGGEIADDGALAALGSMYPDARIRHIYASTEAGVGFSVTDGLAGFPAAYLDEPPAGIEMDVDDAGILLIRSNRSSAGYLGSEQVLKEGSGFVNTGDRVELRGDRYYFLGRDNGSINVGGNKVQPEEVEQVLNSIDGILLSSVSARSSRITGSLIEARIVVDPSIDDHNAFIKSARAFCRERLADFKVPAFITVVPDLETNPTGKIVRS